MKKLINITWHNLEQLLYVLARAAAPLTLLLAHLEQFLR